MAFESRWYDIATANSVHCKGPEDHNCIGPVPSQLASAVEVKLSRGLQCIESDLTMFSCLRWT